MKRIGTLLITVFCASLIYSQNALIAKPDQSNEKAIEILNKAKKAVGKKRSVADIKAMYLKTAGSSRYSTAVNNEKLETETSYEEETSIEFPSRIRFRSKNDHINFFRGKEESNQSVTESILNGNLFTTNSEAFADGQKVNVQLAKRSNEQGIASLKQSALLLTFPLLLDGSWYEPFAYKYVGTVESGDIKAEVVEFELEKKNCRLFFDVETDLLLQISIKGTTKENKPSESKYYFSDYQEKDGLLVPAKTVIEKDGKVISEQTIKELKINLAFKPNFFAVKN